jgi:hypothetical protein
LCKGLVRLRTGWTKVVQVFILRYDFPKGASNHVSREPNIFIALAPINVSHKHVNVGTVTLAAKLKHLIKVLDTCEEAAQAPKSASSEVGTRNSFKLAISIYLDHTDTRADVNEEIREKRGLLSVCNAQDSLKLSLTCTLARTATIAAKQRAKPGHDHHATWQTQSKTHQ